jgi:hypothetical protein
MMYTLNFFIASKCGYTNPFADEATTLIFDKLLTEGSSSILRVVGRVRTLLSPM